MDFSIPTIDTSLVLSTPAPKRAEVAFKEQFWTFLAPFSRNLWLVLLFGGVFTAIFMHVIDPKTTAPLTAVSGGYDSSGRDARGVVGMLKYTFYSLSDLFYQVKLLLPPVAKMRTRLALVLLMCVQKSKCSIRQACWRVPS